MFTTKKTMSTIQIITLIIAMMLTCANSSASSTVTAIASGYYHTIALKGDGTVWTWGHNDYGQLGDGTTTDRQTPFQVSGLTGIIAVAGGRYQSIALKGDGTVWTWGLNSSGQLGDGTNTDRWTPVQVVGPNGAGYLTGVTAIAGGEDYTIALKGDGTVWTWGGNYYGQLGNGAFKPTKVNIPAQVVGQNGVGYLTGVTAIAGGAFHTIAMKGDGTVWTWGSNVHGELGYGTTTRSSLPGQVAGSNGVGYLTGVTAIAGGDAHTVALKGDGMVWTWGYNSNGQLGDGTTADSQTPLQVLGPNSVGYIAGITGIAGGRLDTIALKGDGTVWTWGYNYDGILGDGTSTDRQTPVQVLGQNGVGYLTGITAIAGGEDHTIALQGDGTVWAWGANYNGQLGDGTNTQSSNTPVKVQFTPAQTMYTVTPSASSNGTINPSTPVTVASGATTQFTVTPNTGYTASVGGTCGGNLSGTTYTTSPITANCTVSAVFTVSNSTHHPVYDFNGDGKSDILMQQSSGVVAEWLMNGNVIISGGYVSSSLTGWQVVSVGDFNGDGYADILLQNITSGALYVWLLQGTTILSVGYAGTLDATWRVVAVGDFNGDGKSDILLQNTSGVVALWLMNGSTIISGSGYVTTSLDSSWLVKGAGDFDGDGKSDILLQNTSGSVAVWLMNGSSITSGGYVSASIPSTWQVAGVGDFDGDGKSDILLQNTTSGAIYIWFMNGTTFNANISGYVTQALTGWNIVGVGDYNGDGKSDILLQSTDGTSVAEWLMNGATSTGGGYITTSLGSSWQIK